MIYPVASQIGNKATCSCCNYYELLQEISDNLLSKVVDKSLVIG